MSMPVGNRNLYKLISFTSFSRHFTQPFFLRTERNGNEVTLFFCVIPATAPYIKYIKTRVESFCFTFITDGNLC